MFSRVSYDQARTVADRFVDFKDLIDWDVGNHNDFHEADVDWLNDQVENVTRETSDRKIIVFTQYSPSIDQRTKKPKYPKSTVDSGFITDLSSQMCWRASAVKLWAFGHTHYNFDFTDEETGKRVIANQKGYYAKLPSRDKCECKIPFHVGKTIDIQP